MPALYIHYPYCAAKCVYCDFYSVVTNESPDRFIDALIRELSERARNVDPDLRWSSIFIGGGTPSLMSPAQLERIAGEVYRRYHVLPGAEFSIECNPGTVDREKLIAYRSLGVNRLSFGVQSFHDGDLRFLSRLHTAREAVGAVESAHEAGFTNVSVDLIFSLPGQTADRWRQNLASAHGLGVTHLSCYSLTIEESTPLARMREEGKVELPGEESDALLYETTMETLEGWNYRHYEVSNFARPGFECRHNLSYWRQEDYMGFGPSAHSTWDGKRVWNVSDVQAYMEMLSTGGDATEGEEELTREKLRSEFIFLGLRSGGIDLQKYFRIFGTDFMLESRMNITPLLERGLMVNEDGMLRLTRAGLMLCDEICVTLT